MVLANVYSVDECVGHMHVMTELAICKTISSKGKMWSKNLSKFIAISRLSDINTVHFPHIAVNASTRLYINILCNVHYGPLESTV